MTMPPTLANDMLPSDPAERVRQSRYGTNHVLFSNDGTLVATSNVRMDVSVRRGEEVLFEARFESDLEKIRPTERVRGLAFSEDSTELWIASGDTLRGIDIASGEAKWEYTPPRSYGFLIISPMSVAISDEGLVAATFDNGTMGVWERKGGEVARWKENDAPRNIAFVDGGKRLVGADGFYVSEWDPGRSRRPRTMQFRTPERIYGAAIHPSQPLAATRYLSHATLWNTESQSSVTDIPVGIGLPLIQFHPTEDWVVVSSYHGIEMYTFGGDLVERYVIEDATVVSFGISPSGRQLVVGCSDEILRRFDVRRSGA